MKNYLVRSLYKINSPKWFGTTDREPDLYDKYLKMHEISIRSFEKHLQGEWEFLFFQKEVENIQEVFKDHFFEIYNIWKQEECNIFYCGPDNVMTKPVEVFGKYEDFMMFNYTDPRSAGRNLSGHYGIEHPNFFNADVRYYPHTMSQDIWDMGLKMAENWDFNCWNTEQIILNEMLWKQEGRTLENTLDPTMAYQAHRLTNLGYTTEMDNWNGCPIEDAKIIHTHGSRNASMKLKLMRELER